MTGSQNNCSKPKSETENAALDNAQVKSRTPTKKRIKKILLIISAVILGIAVALAAAFGILWANGRASLLGGSGKVNIPSSELDFAENDGSRVEYKGEVYTYNKNSINILFMGIDKSDASTDLGYGKNGQADSIMIINLDTASGKIKILPISRETVTDISIYSADGNYIGVKQAQLCTAYSYGASGKESCENARQAVSRLLYGIDIGSYIAIDMNGVEALGDVIGGVRLTPIETISGTEITEGKEAVLRGEQINQYLRLRNSDTEANYRRMLRQKHFISEFANQAGNQLLSDFSRLSSFYSTAAPYTVTDITLSEVTYLATCCLTGNIGSSIVYNSISGETAMGEQYMEFHADSTSLLEAVLNTFYLKEE